MKSSWWRRLWNNSLKGRKNRCAFFFVLMFMLFPYSIALGQHTTAEELAIQAEAFDFPGDAGGSLGLRWKIEKENTVDLSYQIFITDREGSDWKKIAEFPTNTHYETDFPGPWWVWGEKRQDVHFFQVKSSADLPLINGQVYFCKIVLSDGVQTIESPALSAIPQANLFNWSKLNNFLLMLAFAAVVLVSIRGARRNPNIFLRRIPGLDAVEEAVGRATEMGKPVLYLTGSGELGGSGDPSSLATIAATVILGEVAKRVATYNTELKVPHRSAIVMALSQEIVKEAYFAAGRPDTYKEESNFFITGDQFAYTAAVDGIMLREQPAANFFLGYYYAESLLLAETGASTGAIQIAGTDADHQLPFFITTCDYTLIGEELYAASAYLSREPVLVGTLRGQDIGKGVLIGVIVLGACLVTLGEILAIPWFRTLLQFFADVK